jgi:putative ABC transport system permease protein
MLWQFCILVIIANLIAWPISFYYASSWLEGFSERISTGEIFVLSIIAAIASLLIASLTVLTNTLKVARSNPANALRYE